LVERLAASASTRTGKACWKNTTHGLMVVARTTQSLWGDAPMSAIRSVMARL
jgi:hypothetical protein